MEMKQKHLASLKLGMTKANRFSYFSIRMVFIQKHKIKILIKYFNLK